MNELSGKAEFALPGAERWAGGAAPRDRLFYVGLAAALLLHSSFLIGLHGAKPRVVGAEDGSLDPVAVSLVTESEFLAQTAPATVPEPPPAAPPAPATQAAAPSEAAPPSPTQPEPVAQPEPQPAPEPQPPPVPETPPQEAQPAPQADVPPPPAEKPELAEQPKTSVAALEKSDPDLLTLPDPGAGTRSADSEPSKSKATKEPAAEQAADKPPKPAQQEKPKPAKPAKQKLAKLDLQEAAASATQSFSAPAFDGGSRNGGLSRPPGITKSGWNDEFARGVIRALQQTMPQMRTEGRVTIRILLDENGNVKSVSVVRPSPDALLTQSVVFAAKQTSYPFPPGGATVADRTFLVTYVYR